MKSTGSAWATLLTLLALTLACQVKADVTAIVDRHDVALGESFRLIITATNNEEISEIDLSPLNADFDIIQRSTSSQMNIINGSRSHTKQLQIDLAPRIEGNLQIPGLVVGGKLTRPLPITVSTAPRSNAAGQAMVFEAELDKDQVYVQEQALLTLRLMRRIEVKGGLQSELELENAFIKPLEQKYFQRTIDGEIWSVNELRYAIFPEQSGLFDIPPQIFVGREVVGRRSLFDFGGGGRSLRRATQALTLEVLPRPQAFPGKNWLPARAITLEEHWSTPPEQLRAGESATRTIRISGEGMLGAQLPPVHFQPIDGLKFYPDQPEINESEVASGLMGKRTDSAALVPTRPGRLALPEIRVPWWDTEMKTVRYAVLPGREISVAAGEFSSTAAPPVATTSPIVPLSPTQVAAAQPSALPWQILSGISTLGWFLTLVYLGWNRRSRDSVPVAENLSERRAFKQLQSACRANDPRTARQALIEWCRILTHHNTLVSLADVMGYVPDDDLNKAIRELDSAMYAATPGDWLGQELEDCVTRLRERYRKENTTEDSTLNLYPRAESRFA